MHERGAVVGYSYQNERFEKFINDFSNNGGGPTFKCDLSSDEEIKGLVEFFAKEWGEIDGIVHW